VKELQGKAQAYIFNFNRSVCLLTRAVLTNRAFQLQLLYQRISLVGKLLLDRRNSLLLYFLTVRKPGTEAVVSTFAIIISTFSVELDLMPRRQLVLSAVGLR